MSLTFARAEEEYRRLRAEYGIDDLEETDDIDDSRERLYNEVDALMVIDDAGNWWGIEPEQGRWHRYDPRLRRWVIDALPESFASQVTGKSSCTSRILYMLSGICFLMSLISCAAWIYRWL